MSATLDIEAQRLENLQHKRQLLESLNLHSDSQPSRHSAKSDPQSKPAPKRRRLDDPGTRAAASRSSARIASSGSRISYNEDLSTGSVAEGHERSLTSKAKRSKKPRSTEQVTPGQHRDPIPRSPSASSGDLPTLLRHYNDWQAIAPEPTLSADGTYHFASHPLFQPNKSPLSILLEGAFGGAHFSPWYSRTLGLSLRDDYRPTLPASWLDQLQPPDKYLTAPTYHAELNKYGVRCGQSLSQWEEAGWINFSHDARGWFEWYVRFWRGRRLDDGEDERQVGRWVRCVGPKGRWKRLLLKKYVEMGVRSIFDDDAESDGREVSPVMHQTCHHWAYQVRQDDLDDAWRERGG